MIDKVTPALQDIRLALVGHELYQKFRSLDDLKLFTQYHVFPVWDFMSLLKALQNELTCVSLPWIPSENPKTRRFINEIVHGEESDLDQEGNSVSHFEMYLDAMQSIGADTTQMESFIHLLKSGKTVAAALTELEVDEAIKEFVNFTFEIISTRKPHIIAAVFTFGREDLIPDMFVGILRGLQQDSKLDKLIYYFERHIELDGDEHGPMSIEMIKELCGEDDEKWKEVIQYSQQALQFRLHLWNTISAKI
ncbi:MAG: DUF3050 domain-containing protein [Flavobacteriaceae bacterium]|nr:DUF3050 domain-containing protein [Flavobacteriaceae bacterium]